MTAHRITVLDLAASFDAATRRADVLAALHVATVGRVGHRSSKTGGKPMDPTVLRRARGYAFITALVEVAEHGVGADSWLLIAMAELVAALDVDMRRWAARRLHAVLAHRGPRNAPVPMRDLAKLKRWLKDRDAEDAAAAPPSGWRRMNVEGVG